MPSHSANVIDLQSYRSRRSLDCAASAPKAPIGSAFTGAGMTWVAVWFVPFAFVGVPVART